MTVEVYVEAGAKRVFAGAIESGGVVRGLKARWCTRYSVKKLCTNFVKEGARAVLGIASLRCLRGVSLEAFGGHGHQIGYSGQVPIGMRDSRMTHVS